MATSVASGANSGPATTASGSKDDHTPSKTTKKQSSLAGAAVAAVVASSSTSMAIAKPEASTSGDDASSGCGKVTSMARDERVDFKFGSSVETATPPPSSTGFGIFFNF